MEFAIDQKFIFYMYELLSASNQQLIRQLLISGCVSMAEIHFNLRKLLGVLYHTPLQCSSFSYVLNSLVASYLKSVVGKSLKSCVLKLNLVDYPINIGHYLADNFILHDCYLHSSKVMKFTHKTNIKPITFDIPVEIQKLKNENDEIVSKEDIFSYVSDFQSFLIPLEQDYTKSSKGYSRYSISINKGSNNMLNKNAKLQINNVLDNLQQSLYEKCIVLEKYGVSYQVQNEFPKYINKFQSKSNNEVIKGFVDICSLQDFDNCIKHSSPKKCSANKLNEIISNVFADTKQWLDCEAEDDSNNKDCFILTNNTVNIAKSDSIIFSESTTVTENGNSSIFSESSVNASEENIIFSEECENLQVTENGILRFWDNRFGESSDDDECDNWDNISDEKSSDLFETLSLDFKSDFQTSSSYLQSEKYTDNEPLNTYEYVNACFEDNDVFELDDHIKNINNNWNDIMKDVSSEPREAKKVSFLPASDLISVHEFEPDNDGYCYSMYVLDQVRFQNRIREFEAVIAPYLTAEHRAKMYSQNYQYKTQS